jgi:hypothetical protein
MKRLVVTGCSFTRFVPELTWPVFLTTNFDETYNYAAPGAGNEYIFHSLIQADTELGLTPEDTVIIQWTGYFRFDYFRDEHDHTRWIGKGDWSHWADTDLMPYLNEKGAIRKTLQYVLMAKRYLEAKGIRYRFTSLYDLRDIPQYPEYRPIINEMYQDHFVYPRGMTGEYHMLKTTRQCYPHFGGHPPAGAHLIFAQTFAQSLGIDIGTHHVDDIDLLIKNDQRYHELYYKVSSHPLYHSTVKNLTRRNNEQVSTEILTYFPDSLENLKKILRDSFTD